jgi:arylsulfatase A-like enzyme
VRARTSLLAASLLVLAGLPACFLFGGGKKPNILLVEVESLRYDAISRASGAARVPNLLQLASEGVAFRSCFSPTPASQPALTSLLSSRLPHEHGVLNNGDPIDEGVALFQEWLTKRGYRTFAAFGLADEVRPQAGHGFERGFGKLASFPHEQATADEVLDSFDAFLDDTPPDRPWFGLLQLTETRQPFDAAEGERVEAQILRDGEDPETLSIGENCWWERAARLPPGRTRFSVRADVPLRVLRFGAQAGKRQLNVVFERGVLREPGKSFVVSVENPDAEPLDCTLSAWLHDAPSLAESRKRYKHETEAVDRALGALLANLRERNLYDDTIVVLTSDHGLALGEHEHLGRGRELFDEFLHVPLLLKPVKGDERIQLLGQSVTSVARLVDIVPTLLDLANVSPMPGAGGSSLVERRRRELVAERHLGSATGSCFAIRDERFKLLLDADTNRFVMYDLRSDTLEQEDVFQLQGHQKPEWQRALGALVGEVHPQHARKSDAGLDQLGY